MSGMSQRRETFFQTKTGDDVVPAYSGPEKRSVRLDLSPEAQLFLDELRDLKDQINCKNNCIIREEFHENANHPFFEAKKFGRGNTENGINELSDQAQKLRNRLNLEALVGKWALRAIVVSLVVCGLGMLAVGFIDRVKG